MRGTIIQLVILSLLFFIGFQLLLVNYLFQLNIFNVSKLVKPACSPTVHQNISTSRQPPLILLVKRWEKDRYWNFNWVDKTQISALYLVDCPYKCRFTIDEQRYLDTADMVILNTFLYRFPSTSTVLSRQRILENQIKTGQIWVCATAESPHYHRRLGYEVYDVFYWIATYRSDADIFWPYWSYTKRAIPLKSAPKTTKPKKKLAAWLVSHCSTQSHRELLVKALQRHIPLDIYGKCGKPCPNGLDCRAYLAANYKFYLAFENALCVDYVTEKLFLMLRRMEPIVPVTYSWINDSTLAPPNSYIDARDFKSIKALADFLKYLDKNDDEYDGYLRWRQDYKMVQNPSDIKLCRACQMLLRYKEQLDRGGERIKRRPRLLSWLNSLGSGTNFSYFKVAGNLVETKTVCFKPLENNASRNWLRGTPR